MSNALIKERRMEHALIKTVAKAALDAGMSPHSEQFRSFYETLERCVAAYDVERGELIERLTENAIETAMRTPSVPHIQISSTDWANLRPDGTRHRG